MATSLSIECKRGDLFRVNPYDIIVTEKLRGRSRPPTNEEIIARAESMLENGQLQPCVVRHNADKTIEQVSGFTRNAAARLIRDGFTGTDGTLKQDKDFLLAVIVRDCDDLGAIWENIEENIGRLDLNPIDHAHQQQRLREEFGVNDAEIARRYRWDPATVSRHKHLLKLDEATKELVRTGAMAMNAALDLTHLPDAERQKIVAEAKKGEKVSTAQVRKAVRNRHLNDDNKPAPVAAQAGEEGQVVTQPSKPPEASTGPKPRTLKEVKDFFAEVQGEIPLEASNLCSKVCDYITGKCGDKALVNALKKAVGKE